MARRLYICVVFNHPWAKRNHYYEEENGEVQEIKMVQDGVWAKPDGYVGEMYPFKELMDACVEIMPRREDTAGVMPAKLSKINPSNYAHQSVDEDPFALDLE